MFFSELKLPVLNEYELYGSKLVAALDRQHPRDLSIEAEGVFFSNPLENFEEGGET